MTREEFRAEVFARDHYKCVFCEEEAVDAHHIIERRLWPDGGYCIPNGASVCAECHYKCETITKPIIPEHLYDDQVYDKWGNPILPDGRRLKGELFEDESVQKVFAERLRLFTHYVKYPRTYHLPWSDGMNDDDRIDFPVRWQASYCCDQDGWRKHHSI